MLYLLCFPLGLVASGVTMLIYTAYSAPEGFEDEQGFHQSTGVGLHPAGADISSKKLSYK